MAYKPEHMVDLETGAIVGVAVHPEDQSEMATIEETLEVAKENLEKLRDANTLESKEDDTDDNGVSTRGQTGWTSRRGRSTGC